MQDTMDKTWFINRDYLKKALQYSSIKDSIEKIIIKELEYKNGEIEYLDYDLKIDYQDLANQLASYFEQNNLTINDSEPCQEKQTE